MYLAYKCVGVRAQAAAARSFEELQSSLAALGTGLKVWLAVHPIMHALLRISGILAVLAAVLCNVRGNNYIWH